jgi:sugar phosphate isomerase/epimerase
MTMRLGIFAKTFARPSVEDTFDAVRAHGLAATQFNLSVTGLPSMPDSIPAELADRVRAAARARDLDIAAVSGTFNMAHPDRHERARGLRRLDVLAGACGALGTGVVTLCTGTRDRDDMWRRHADNTTTEAWRDMRDTIATAIAIAERHDIVLAIEPEVGNVVHGPAGARRLLDEIESARLRVVIDAANLFDAEDPSRRIANSEAVLTEAFDLLAGDIVLAHAKDITADGSFAAAGRGDVDWERYLTLLDASGYTGALVMHGLDEADVARSTTFLVEHLNARA